ncbi:MAG: chemotaxis protein CheW [Deltaproteobacteria bacterium]|nr:chemotaxis protein CheW [Deltaproteobacteria bacterium]
MDILSIRKKGRKGPPETPAQTKATTTTAAAAEAAAASSPPPSVATRVEPEPHPAFAPPPSNEIPRRAPAMSNETIIDDAPAPPPAVAVVDDPLRGFLAMYDVDERGDERPLLPVTNHDGGDTTRRYLSFRLVDEEYAASIMDIREILTIRSLTEVPRAPKEVLGVVSKRGVVLPVIDLATSLGLRAAERRLRPSQRVLVVGDGDRVCGLRVDAVSEVIKLQHGQIESVPASLGQKNAGLLLGLGRVEGTMYILLDVNAVLDAFAVAMGVAPTTRVDAG